MIHIPGQPVELNFSVPREQCCNCGSSQGVQLQKTELKHTRYMLLAGTELTLTLELPYCPTYSLTAKRFRSTLFTKALVAFGLFWALLLAGLVGVAFIPALEDVSLTWVAGSLALILTAAFYATRRPSPNQTSYYQPVSLAKLKQKFTGGIVGVGLRCTNAQFAQRFSAMNQSLVSEGALEVRGA